MKTKNWVFVGRVLAVAILILGIIHDVATFSPLIGGGLSGLSINVYNSMIYMSLMCGMFLVLSGILLFLLLNKTERCPSLKSVVLLMGAFLMIDGALAVFYMSANPFAWMTFFMTMGMFVVTIVLKVKR